MKDIIKEVVMRGKGHCAPNSLAFRDDMTARVGKEVSLKSLQTLTIYTMQLPLELRSS